MATAEQYQAKVSAYFLTTLGRPASAAELDGYTQVLADNNGSVWKPAGGSLVSYLTPLLEAETAGQSNGQIVTDMFVRMTGSEPAQSLYNYYVSMLDQGVIKLKGLANAMLNDLKLMPNVDGGFDQPATWTVDKSGELLEGQRDAMIAKTGVADEFTAHLDTPEENNAFIKNPGPATELLTGVTDQASADAAMAMIDSVIAEIVNGGSGADTFTLTNDTDIATANIFEAPQVYTPGGDDRINSLQDEDVLTGRGDNPTLNATLGNANDNGGTVITPTLNDIETINVAFTGSGFAVTDLDLQDADGVTEVNISRVSQAINRAEVANMQSVLDSMSIANSNANQAGTVEFSFGAGVLSGDNTGALTLDSVNLARVNIGQNTSGVGVNGVGNQGYEHLAIESTGTSNAIGALNLPMDTGTEGSVTITGDQDLTLATTTPVTHPVNTNLVESITYAGGIQLANGRLASIDASALEGDLTLNIAAGVFTTGKADTSGVNQDVSIIGGAGDDTFILRDRIQSGDSLDGGDGDDLLIVNAGGIIDATSSVVNGIENLEVRLDGLFVPTAAATVDFDKLPDITSVLVRNEGSNDAATPRSQAQVATFNLNNLTAEQAAAISIAHSNTFSNGIAQNVVNATLKDASGPFDPADPADLVNVTIAEGYNADPRFNFTLNTQNATGATGRVEDLTLTDADTESNTVSLGRVVQHTGTVTLTDGLDDTFLNLDTTIGGDINGDLVVDNLDYNGGLYQYDTTGADDLNSSLAGVGRVADHSLTPGQVKLIAATIDASGEASDVVVRVSTNAASPVGAQTITMGSGDDTVIFDNVPTVGGDDTRAGLSISDTVSGGAGNDTLVIDGNVGVGNNINLSASEWTNVSGFETIRTIGAGAGNYNLTLTNSLVAANHGANGYLNIVNDNDAFNDTGRTFAEAWAPIAITNADGTVGFQLNDETQGAAGYAVESGITLDARSLSDTTKFTYDGEEYATRTADRIILSDANINGSHRIDGGAIDNITNNRGIASLNGTTVVGNGIVANKGNADVIEVRNAAVVSQGDLANIKNIGTLSFTNDFAATQVSTLQLNDNVVDAMVDSYQASKSRAAVATQTTGGANVEVLQINVVDNINTVTGLVTSTSGLTIEAGTLTDKSDLDITLGRGANNVTTGGGQDRVVLLGDYATGAYAVGVNENGVNINAQADNQAGPRLVNDTINLGAGIDTLVTYGAINLGGAAITNVENVVANSDLVINASQLAALLNLTFAQGVNGAGVAIDHTLRIVNDGTGAAVDLSKIHLAAGAGNLSINVDAGVNVIGGTAAVDEDETDTGEINLDGYSLTSSANDVDEGSAVTFTLTRTDATQATTVAYNISGTGITADDFNVGQLSGNFSFAAGVTQATVTIDARADATTEGAETFKMAIANGLNRSVIINDTSMAGGNTAPVAVDDVAETDAGEAVTFNILANDTDADGDVLSIQIVDDPDNGSVIDNGNGTITYTPDPGFEGVEAFNYVVTDGALTDTGLVTVTVNPVGGETIIILDGQGTDADPVAIDAAADAFNFTDSAAVANNVVINNFGIDDLITISGATEIDYDTVISSDAAGDVTIAYNDNGTLSQIVLTGVAVGSFAFDVNSFNALAVGDLNFA